LSKKVSIIGAGLSGLSCAFYLEKQGLQPIIYEKNSKIGGYYVVAEAMLSILTRPVIDPYLYFGREYGLYLKPYQTVSSMIIHSPNKKNEIVGFQGFTNLRGDIDSSLERQISEHISTSIIYEHTLTLREIIDNSDHVVVATGDPSYIEDIQSWETDVNVDLMVGTIEGNFKPSQIQLWLNNEFAPKGYAYMLPINEKRANIAIGIPKQEDKSLDDLWRIYTSKLTFPFKMVDTIDIHNYKIGQPERNQVGNTLFIGNAGGFLQPFLGFGQFNAIRSGILAAEAIIKNEDFNQLVKPFRSHYKRSLALRKTMETMTGEHYDMLVSALKPKIMKQIYLNPKFDLIKWVSNFLSLSKFNT